MKTMKMTAAALFAACITSPAVAGIGLSEFYITDAQGRVFSVDTGTYEASLLFDIDPNGIISDLAYIGNDRVLVHNGGVFTSYDVNSSAADGTVEYDLYDRFGDGIHFANGIDIDPTGQINFFIQSYLPSGGDGSYSASYDPATDSYATGASYDTFAYFLDVHRYDGDVFLGADWNENAVRVFDSVTGETIAEHQVGFGVVSFFEVSDVIYAVGKLGGVYTYDPTDGSTSLLGTITGAGDSIIGATVPAPSGLALFGAGLLGVSRRRR